MNAFDHDDCLAACANIRRLFGEPLAQIMAYRRETGRWPADADPATIEAAEDVEALSSAAGSWAASISLPPHARGWRKLTRKYEV